MATNAQRTLGDAFKIEPGFGTPGLPDVDPFPGMTRKKRRAIGDTPSSISPRAFKVPAPKYATRMDFQSFIDIADEFLKKHDPGLQFLSQEYIDAADTFRIRINEADVVNVTNHYMLHAVNRVLSLGQESYDIRNLAESATRLPDLKYKTDEGDDKIPDLHLDSCYMRVKKDEVPSYDASGRPGETNSRTFAVIEMKASGKILVEELERAFKKENEDTTESRLRATRARESGQSRFGLKSILLIKQGAWYAIGRRMRHVALFDYNTLVLWFFKGMSKIENVTPNVLEEEMRQSKEGVDMSIIEKEKIYGIERPMAEGQLGPKPRVEVTGGQIFRVVLLGFLLHGLENTTSDVGGP
ncbi:hypothetical protein ACHAQA_006797 [Verticillium albo-atrum]